MPTIRPNKPLFLKSDPDPRSTLERRLIGAQIALSETYDPSALSLNLHQGVLSLLPPKHPHPLSINFQEPPYRYTVKKPGDLPLLAKACGYPKHTPRILDTTAGLGQDSFLLASLGCSVSALEHHPLIYLLLDNAWRRLGIIKQHLDLSWHHASALDVLHSTTETFDVILIDPMFNAIKNQAKPQKNMQALRLITPNYQPNWSLWFQLAWQKAPRIVIKQPQKAAPLPLPKPTFCVAGKAMRFDVWCR